MTSMKEINAAVITQLRNATNGTRFAGIKVDTEDISENVKRPSLKVFCDGKYSQKMLTRELEVTVEIFFFAEDSRKYKIDCADMQECLQLALLEGLKVNGEAIEITDLDFATANKTLSCNFVAKAKGCTHKEAGEIIEKIEWRAK